jgi:hypothetical protein
MHSELILCFSFQSKTPLQPEYNTGSAIDGNDARSIVMNSPGQPAIVTGLAAIVATAVGCVSFPQLFYLVTVGDISGPLLLCIVTALATLLVAGARLLFVARSKGE